jgi:hypothetical protein
MTAGDERHVPLMSTGVPSTLGNWHAMCVAVFGAESPATAFIKAKLDAQGPDMAVIADEGQLLYALMVMNFNGPTGGDDLPST